MKKQTEPKPNFAWFTNELSKETNEYLKSRYDGIEILEIKKECMQIYDKYCLSYIVIIALFFGGIAYYVSNPKIAIIILLIWVLLLIFAKWICLFFMSKNKIADKFFARALEIKKQQSQYSQEILPILNELFE